MDSGETWQIVLIDDEPDIREVVSIALQDAGCTVASAGDGESGLRLCRSVRPQIVITDIRMPRMDGLEVLAAVKKMDPDIQVIVVTAFAEMDLAIQALQLDASDFITKPVHDDALRLALKRARERYNTRKQLKDYTALLEKEKAETLQELVRTFTFQKNLIESSMDGIVGCDPRDRVMIFNRSMEEMLDTPRREVLGKRRIQDLFPEGEAERILQKLATENHGGKNRLALHESELIDASGEKIPVQLSAVRLEDGGSDGGWVSFFRDLRKIRALENEVEDQARILHQDKMMSLGRLAASVVHEINNPLSGILNYLRLMSRVLARGRIDNQRVEKFREYLELVESETARCSRIVSGLLAFSRKSAPEFATVRIEEMLARCVSLSNHKLELQQIVLELRIEDRLPPVPGDFNQLQQAMINLIFNAVDAMPDGGRLMLASRSDSSGRSVIIEVSDTGHGIDEGDLPHIFEPFFTRKKNGVGVGLGLSTVYGIIQHHGGSVEVESRPGRGTTFTVHLPVEGNAGSAGDEEDR